MLLPTRKKKAVSKTPIIVLHFVLILVKFLISLLTKKEFEVFDEYEEQFVYAAEF